MKIKLSKAQMRLLVSMAEPNALLHELGGFNNRVFLSGQIEKTLNFSTFAKLKGLGLIIEVERVNLSLGYAYTISDAGKEVIKNGS